MLELLFAEDGRFFFCDVDEHAGQADTVDWDLAIPGGVGVLEVLMDGMRRLDEWRDIRKSFPHDHVLVHALAFATDVPAVQGLIDGGGELPLRDLCLRLRIPRFQVLEQLYQALCRGEVAIEETSHLSLPDGGPTQEETLLRAARNLLAEKQFEEATALLSGLRELDPLDPAVTGLLKRVRAEHLRELYKEMPARVRPIRTLADPDQCQLTPEERHMLSRINGRYDVATLLAVTSLSELSSLRSLHRLHRLALIRLE
jgi:hypothetical protein